MNTKQLCRQPMTALVCFLVSETRYLIVLENQIIYSPNWAETTLLDTCDVRSVGLSFVISGKSLLLEYTMNWNLTVTASDGIC